MSGWVGWERGGKEGRKSDIVDIVVHVSGIPVYACIMDILPIAVVERD